MREFAVAELNENICELSIEVRAEGRVRDGWVRPDRDGMALNSQPRGPQVRTGGGGTTEKAAAKGASQTRDGCFPDLRRELPPWCGVAKNASPVVTSLIDVYLQDMCVAMGKKLSIRS